MSDAREFRANPTALVADFYTGRVLGSDTEFLAPPVVREIALPGRGWVPMEGQPDLTVAVLSDLRQAGVTRIQLAVSLRRTRPGVAEGHPQRFMDGLRYPDFAIEEFYADDERLGLVPCSLKQANDFTVRWHRHAGRTAWGGGKFALAAEHRGRIVGVVIVGRPLSRALSDQWTMEVTRLCTGPLAPDNTCSFLYSAAKRAWQAMGGRKLVTYTLDAESGGSLRGAGWAVAAKVTPKKAGWSSGTRERTMKEVYGVPKLRWEIMF